MVEVEEKGREVEGETATKKDDDPELKARIVRQIEYYFGDINLPRDKFLQEQIRLDEGWVPYATMLNFKRLAALSTDTDLISEALRASSSGLVEVSGDGAKIRRSPELPAPELDEERRKELSSRTAYAKGLPKEGTTLDDCLAFFRDSHPEAENVIMRRYLDRATKEYRFKGSVFVTFKTKEQAEAFVAADSIKWGERELLRKWQADYLEEKKKENEEKYNKAVEKKNAKNRKREESKIVFPKGSVLILSEVPEDFERNKIKDAINKLEDEAAFVQIAEGKAWVRLKTENSAERVYARMTDGKLTVDDDVRLPCELPDREAEDKFLAEMADELAKRKQRQNKHGGGGGGHRNYGNRKRQAGSKNGGPDAKKKA